MEYLSLLLLISFICAIIHFLISTFVTKLTPKSSKVFPLPPGPRPYPIIGNILELGTLPHKSLAKLSQTYGPIMSLKLGSTTAIVISSPKLAKEILQKYDQICSHRKIPDTLRALDHYKRSIIWLPPNNQWRNLRRVCATKMFSSQKLDSTQALRQRKVLELMDYVKEKCERGEALDIGEASFTTMLNIISNYFFSLDLGHYNSEKSQEFNDLIRGMMEEAGRPNIVDFFPVLRRLDPQGARARMHGYFAKTLSFMDSIVEERLSKRGSEKESKAFGDVLDSLLQLMLEEDSQITRSQLLHLFLDLFVAGVDTSSNTVEWAMTELLSNPKVLEKVRKELQETLGNDEQIEESHISKLPLLRALVKETFRLHPPAPFLVPHKSEIDVELCDYTVPKNAQILINVWAMGKDSNIWANANEFLPERFLENKIDFKGQDFELITFGAGRRICPGLPLAYRTVHIMLASLLHGYDWKLLNEKERIDMSEKYGITLNKALPLHVVPIKR